MSKLSILYDASLCTACRGCQIACKGWNDLPGLPEEASNWGTYENPRDLSKDTWLKIRFFEFEREQQVEWIFSTQACMHCTEAACVEVCPTGALSHHPEYGYVMVDRDKCNGCGYCTQYCPFGIPRLELDVISGAAKVFKCTFCQDRVANGEVPACVKACTTGALRFGEHDELVAYANERVNTLKAEGKTEANVYGADLLGGLGRIFVLLTRPEAVGLPESPKGLQAARVWQKVIQPAAMATFGASLATAAVAWVVARRNIRMEEVE